MLENTTNMTSQIDGTTIGFFSKPCIEPILIAVLILATIFVGWWAKRMHKRSDLYNRFQQVYNELLIPSEVELEYTEKLLKYTQENHREWNGFIDAVNKHKRWKYNMGGLYKKIKDAFENFETSSKSFCQKAISIVQKMNEENDCGFLIWEGDGDPSSGDFIEKKQIPRIVKNVIGGTPIKIYQSGYGGYALEKPYQNVRARSENTLKNLGELIKSTIDNDDEIKKLLSKCKKEKMVAEKLLAKYNTTLIKIIHDLRFCRW